MQHVASLPTGVFLALQTAWRGHYERTTHPKAKRLAELRRRIARAKANAVGQAHRSVGARTRVALEGLLAATHLASVRACQSRCIRLRVFLGGGAQSE